MIKYVVKKMENSQMAATNGKWYAFPVFDDTMDLNAMARHMATHNSGYAEGVCIGVMKAMVTCIKEQVLDGKCVKIDDLAIFSVGIRNRKGADSAESFTTSANIAGVKLRARATGELSNAQLNMAVTLKKAVALTGLSYADGTDDEPSGGNTGGGSGNTGGGSSSSGGGSSSSGGGSSSSGGGSSSSGGGDSDSGLADE